MTDEELPEDIEELPDDVPEDEPEPGKTDVPTEGEG